MPQPSLLHSVPADLLTSAVDPYHLRYCRLGFTPLVIYRLGFALEYCLPTMRSILDSLPSLYDLFPPTPVAYSLLITVFQYFPVVSENIFSMASRHNELTDTAHHSPMDSVLLPGWKNIREELLPQHQWPAGLVHHGNRLSSEPALYPLQAAADGQY